MRGLLPLGRSLAALLRMGAGNERASRHHCRRVLEGAGRGGGAHHIIAEERGALVREAAMHKEQMAQEAELADGEIGVVDRLHAFFSNDSNTDVSRLRQTYE